MPKLGSKRISSAFVIASFVVAGNAYADSCQIAEVIAPAGGETVASARPGIEWRVLPSVARYRLQMESRVPEGRVLARFDTVVAGTRFVPPTALTDERAAVKVLVTADCGVGNQAGLIEEPARFFIDLKNSCPAPASVQVNDGKTIGWGKVAGAQRYELAVYSAIDGRSVLHAETVQPVYRLPAPQEPAYVMVRARCAEAYSARVYQVLGSSTR